MAVTNTSPSSPSSPSSPTAPDPQDVLVSFGLGDLGQAFASDFDGTVTNAFWGPFDYDGHMDYHVLALCLEILPDEDSGFDPIVQWYSAGDLKNFQPSKDGKTPVSLEGDFDLAAMSGPRVVRVGTKKMLSPSSNMGFFLSTLKDAGHPREEMEHVADAGFFIGLRGHWMQVDQPERTGLKKKKEGKSTILCVTEYKGRVDVSTLAKTGAGKQGVVMGASGGGGVQTQAKAQNTASTTTTTTTTTTTYSPDVVNYIHSALRQAGLGVDVTKADLLAKASMDKANKALKPQIINFLNDDAALGANGGLWVYDPGDDTLTAVS
jgi:hypothetical protein